MASVAVAAVNILTARPALICAPHGTASEDGLATLRALVDTVAALRPDHDVRLAYLDVAHPSLADVVAKLDSPAVVVPVLLASGYHVRTDVPAVLGEHPHVDAAAALGPDPAITDALIDRLDEARRGQTPGELVVLLAAGSSDAAARADVAEGARDLAARLDIPVEVAVLSGPGARLADVVAAHPSIRIDVARYLLAPGTFADRAVTEAKRLGIETVTDVLGVHPAIARLVWDRYDNAVATDR